MITYKHCLFWMAFAFLLSVVMQTGIYVTKRLLPDDDREIRIVHVHTNDHTADDCDDDGVCG